jgi:hypothetical protein
LPWISRDKTRVRPGCSFAVTGRLRARIFSVAFPFRWKSRLASAFALEPRYGFFLQGLVIAEGNAGRPAAAAANALLGVDVDGALLVQDCAYCADRLCITRWAIMLADGINHNECLLEGLLET